MPGNRHKLEKQVAFLDAHSEIGAVFTNALAITEAGSPLLDEGHFYFDIFDQPNRTRHEWLRLFFSRGNALCHPSVLIRKSCYEDCGLYRFGLAQTGDIDMWIRLCMRHEIHVLPEKLVRFRVRDNEANSSGSSPETRIRGVYEFYRSLQNYRELTSFEDLVKVFPSAAGSYRDEETDVEFLLAMAALEEKRSAFTQLFGLDLLFEVISDVKRSAAIKRLYGFDYKSFIALTASHDVFCSRDIVSLNGHIASLSGHIANLNAHIANLDGDIGNLIQALAERDERVASLHGHIAALVQAVAERDGQVAMFATEEPKSSTPTAGESPSL